MIREDILQKFPDLFGTKQVNGREVNVEKTITTLTREVGSGDRQRSQRTPDTARVPGAGAHEICLAEVGRGI